VGADLVAGHEAGGEIRRELPEAAGAADVAGLEARLDRVLLARRQAVFPDGPYRSYIVMGLRSWK
jgi:hypothetical protein